MLIGKAIGMVTGMLIGKMTEKTIEEVNIENKEDSMIKREDPIIEGSRIIPKNKHAT